MLIYPIPFDPPFVPSENPCGVYHRTFEYRSDSDYPKSYLNFEGVDSCFYLYINGNLRATVKLVILPVSLILQITYLME